MRKYATVDPQDGAFAGPSSTGYQPGITKREYFTAVALQGLLASHPSGGGAHEENYYAESAVSMADKVIAELNKEVENVG